MCSQEKKTSYMLLLPAKRIEWPERKVEHRGEEKNLPRLRKNKMAIQQIR